MANTLLDKFKRFIAPFFFPAAVVDDDPPTLADGDTPLFRAHKTNRGVYVHVANQDSLVAKFADGVADNNVGAAVSKTVKSSAGVLLSMSVRHADAADLFLWIWDSTTTSGTALIIPTLIPAATHVVVGTDFFTTKGIAFSTGLTYGFSTSSSTYSAYGTAGNCAATMVYQ